MEWTQVVRLRERADALDALAARIDAAAVRAVPASADENTWMGPGPTRCRAVLAGHLARLDSIGGELRARARSLDRQAHELELRLSAAAVGGN